MTGYYYDRDGNPITMQRFGELHRQRDYVVIAKTVNGDAKVSTVWLGIDHNFDGGEPLIFETMVFRGGEEEGCWRYATEGHARAGHAEVCSAVFRGEVGPGA